MDVEQYYDDKAPFYDGEYTIPFYQLYKKITWDNIQRFLPEKGTILDAGGGTGEWTVQLAEKGYQVVLTDISQGMLRQARQKLEEKNISTVTIKRVDITDMSCFEDNTFDMTLAQGDPLSYCNDAEKAVSELYRVLKSGGHCIASVDSFHYLLVKLIYTKRWGILKEVVETGKAKFQMGFTIRYFTPASLSILFADAGFSVIRIVGKPVFSSVLPRDKVHNLLSDPHTFDQILELELNHCDNPHLTGFASHLEIVGKK